MVTLHQNLLKGLASSGQFYGMIFNDEVLFDYEAAAIGVFACVVVEYYYCLSV